MSTGAGAAYNTTPRAFVPHSAINLSVKTSPAAQQPSSLDLSVSGEGSSFLSPTAGAGGGSQILDLTRDKLYKNRSSGKTDSHYEKGSSGSPILLKIVSENQFSGKIYFYTIASRSDSGYGSSSPRTSTSLTTTSAAVTPPTSSSSAAKKSKVEQTEPVDFSSGQQLGFAAAARSTGTFDDLSRYRSPGGE